MASWTIGSARITRIEELLGIAAMLPEKYLIGLDREVLRQHIDWLAPNHYSPENDRLVTSVHSWLIQTGRHTILLDCCAGRHKQRPWSPRFHNLDTPYLQRLAAAGVQPEQVDIVLCTHLHADHVGWNTVRRDGRWVPTFPNAKYLFARQELAGLEAPMVPGLDPAAADDPRRLMYADSVLPIVEARQAVLIDDGHAIDGDMTVEAAPGHTPGHVNMVLRSQGGRAIFCGDSIHHALQVYVPHWHHAADEAPAQATATRRRLLERCASEQALLFPTHFGAPHVARINAKGSSFYPTFIEPREA